MGFVGLLKFAFLCFDFLAWPIFALGCPLYASVRAIETNSNSDMRNLVAYWIIFSLISLFELAFVRLIDWLPFWPYMKLLGICWLVVPHFNGACYVYECLLRPCLSVNPRVVIKYLIKPKENPSLSAESFLAVAERYVKENGSEALEKLIDSKSKHTKPNTDVEEMKAVTNTEEETAAVIRLKPEVPNIAKENVKYGEIKEKNPAATTEWVNCVDSNLTQIEKKTVGAGEIKEKTVAAACGENKVPEIPTSEKVQREWTCDLCQVKTTNEKTLDHHLQGKKHKAKCEKLNLSKQANKNKGCSPPKANDLEAEKPVFSDGPNQSNTKKQEGVVQPNQTAEENVKYGEIKEKNPAATTERVNCVDSNLTQIEKKTVGAGEIKEKTVAAACGENKVPEIRTIEKVQREWTCDLCQVTTTNEKTLDHHLQGKKHKAKCEKLNVSKQANKNKGCSPPKANDHEAEKPVFSDGPNQSNTMKQEGMVQPNQTAEPCKLVLPKFWCSLCDVKCLSEIDLASHINGQKHLSSLQSMIDSLSRGR